MWFFSPQIVKIIANITLIGLGFLLVPGSTFAFNLNARGFFTKKVDASDQFIRNLNLQADCIVDTTAGAVTFYTEHAFSAIEKLTGLSTQNQLYRYGKNNSLATVGFGLGLLKGTKDFATGTVSLLAYLDSMPARTVTLAYNVQERPLEYKAKVVTGGKTVAAVLQNPQPLLSGIYQWGYQTYTDAQKDPLKKGQLYGEGTVFAGTFLLGGGQLKGATSANKAIKAANSGKLASTGALANSGTVVKGAQPGILAKAVASIKGINLGALIPDFSRINIGGFGFAAPVAAGTGKSAGMATLKGTWGTKATYASVKMESINIPVAKGGLSGTADVTGLSAAQAVVNSGSKVKYPLTWSELKPEWALPKFFPHSLEKSIIKWADQKYSKWATGLSQEDREVFWRFTVANQNLNRVIRGVMEPSAQDLADIAAVQRVLQSAPSLDEPIILFRTTSTSILGPIAKLPERRMIGQEFKTEGFISSSIVPLSEDVLKRGSLNLVMNVPKDITGACIKDISFYPKELEFVFTSGSMKIKDAYRLDPDTTKDTLLLFVDVLK